MKYFLSILSFFLFCFFLVPGAYASEKSTHTEPSYAVSSITESLVSLLAGYTDNNGKKSPGAVSLLTTSIGSLSVARPVSLREFVAYEGSRFRVPFSAQPVYADAGAGFVGIDAVLTLWVTMRNLTYLVFSIIFVVIGIMIILRIKVDSKTVLTVQSALPRMLLAVVAVSFSYAMAGFLVDVMYVCVGLIIYLGHQIFPGGTIATALEEVVGDPVLNYVGLLTGNGFLDKISLTTSAQLGTVLSKIFDVGFFSKIFSVLSSATSASVGGVGLHSVAEGFIQLAVAIALLYALFKTWIMLITSYANIILAIIFAPVRLLFEVFPGQDPLQKWIREMLSELLTFPLVMTMILIATAIGLDTSTPSGTPFLPPLIGATSMDVGRLLVAFGIVLTIPKAAEMMHEFLKAPQSKLTSAVTEAMNIGLASATLAYGRGPGLTGGAYGLGARGLGAVASAAGITPPDWGSAIRRVLPFFRGMI
jgi:hypothetical protein